MLITDYNAHYRQVSRQYAIAVVYSLYHIIAVVYSFLLHIKQSNGGIRVLRAPLPLET